MTTRSNDDDDLPASVKDNIHSLHNSLSDVETILSETFLDRNIDDLKEKMTPLEKARIDLMAVYAANSLFWAYLCTKGESPSDTPLKDELTRIKLNMDRVKEIEDKAKAPRLIPHIAKNMIRNAMFDVDALNEAKRNTEIEVDDEVEVLDIETDEIKNDEPFNGSSKKRKKTNRKNLPNVEMSTVETKPVKPKLKRTKKN